MTHSWYLGIDFNAFGIAAILHDCRQHQAYSLYWLLSDSASAKSRDIPEFRSFVLPIGWSIEERETESLSSASSSNEIVPLPPYFHWAIPCYDRQSRQWQPQFRGAGGRGFSLHQLQKALQALLETFNPSQPTSYRVRAVALSENRLKEALLALEGIILNCSASWGDTYRFNLREAILGAQLVETPDRIFFLEEAIAIGLSVISHQSPVTSHQLSEIGERQGILILQGGMITTELALVENVPLESLKHEDWALRAFEYGQIDLDYDIFFQLLYPQWLPEQEFLQSLNLEIPQPGEPDRPKRDRATAALENFSEGHSLLETAKRTFLILQKQAAFSTFLGHQEWGATRSALEEKILLPLWEQLNRQINELLSQKGWHSDAIARVFCRGEMFARVLPFLQSRLSLKFPRGEIVPLQNDNNNNTSIATGLSRLPLFPQMLDRLRHQYSDYFLLAELLRAARDDSLTLEQIVKSLERRGIPRACSWRILPFLAGELPEGLIPSAAARGRMTDQSRQFIPYPAIASAPLFTAQLPRYHLNPKQGKRVQQYLSFLLATSTQKLDDPLAIDFVIN
ncbi:MAG: hypothetical protein AB4290_01410 [Spirulina sp.]